MEQKHCVRNIVALFKMQLLWYVFVFCEIAMCLLNITCPDAWTSIPFCVDCHYILVFIQRFLLIPGADFLCLQLFLCVHSCSCWHACHSSDCDMFHRFCKLQTLSIPCFPLCQRSRLSRWGWISHQCFSLNISFFPLSDIFYLVSESVTSLKVCPRKKTCIFIDTVIHLYKSQPCVCTTALTYTISAVK